MPQQFFEELKQQRETQKITLAEISNRTKINPQYLEQMEKGVFTFLPSVYVRLFLKAYALEIGAEPTEILQRFEKYLVDTGQKIVKTEELEEISFPESQPIVEESEDKYVETQEKTPAQIRSDWIKAGLLIGIMIFAIFIIQKITSPEETKSKDQLLEEEYSKPLSIEDLEKNYKTANIVIQTVSIDSPYTFHLQSPYPMWYGYIADNGIQSSNLLPTGGNGNHGFNSEMRLLLRQTKDVELKISNTSISLPNEKYPVEIKYNTSSDSLRIQQFIPK